MKFLVINGPNLNLLGLREKDIYGTLTYAELCKKIENTFPEDAFTFFQSNHEGEIIDCLHTSIKEKYDGIIINAGAYTHTSIAIRDAIKSVEGFSKCVEVHLSNINAREEFRKISYLSAVCRGQISGFGLNSYILAVQSFKY